MSDTPIQPALIFRQLARINADIVAVAKSGQNNQQGYAFRKIDDIYDHLHGLFAKHGVYILQNVRNREERIYETQKGGKQFKVTLELDYVFTAEDGSSTQSRVIGEGVDSSDKATNKAQQAALKYCLIQLFTIPVKEQIDPDQETIDVLNDDGSQDEPQSQKILIEATFDYKNEEIRKLVKTAGFKYEPGSRRWTKEVPSYNPGMYPFETREVTA